MSLSVNVLRLLISFTTHNDLLFYSDIHIFLMGGLRSYWVPVLKLYILKLSKLMTELLLFCWWWWCLFFFFVNIVHQHYIADTVCVFKWIAHFLVNILLSLSVLVFAPDFFKVFVAYFFLILLPFWFLWEVHVGLVPVITSHKYFWIV